MKNLTICLFTLFAVLMFSCKKDKQADTPSTYYIKANKNGLSWSGNPFSNFRAEQTKPDTIVLGGGKGTDNLVIWAKKNSQGNYDLITDRTQFSNIVQNAFASNYALDITADNAISITKPSSSEIQGSFKLTFKKINGDASYPATVSFNQGEFKSALSIAL